MTLTVIIATLGRPSLDNTIRSIEPQLGPVDEVLVATRFPERVIGRLPDGGWRLVHTPVGEAYGGANERNAAMPYATCSHLCFIDDDDVYAPGALDAMREHAAPDRPTIFRMDGTRLGIGVIWQEPVLRYTNVSTAMLVVPNIPDQLGHWEAHHRGRGCDFTFISETVEKMGPPVFRHEIVAVSRPAMVAA